MPDRLAADTDRNDAAAWSALFMLEVRMLLARGQTYQARKIVELLPVAAEADLPVKTFERREIQQLINAIDSSQAGRHYLALQELQYALGSSESTIQWAAQMWAARSLACENNLAGAREAASRAIALGAEVAADARYWAICFAAEVQARGGETDQAELSVLRVLSQFIDWGETRGESLAYLSIARVNHIAGAGEESVAAAERAYTKDGSWTGPVIWLARLALDGGDVDRAENLLRSIPNPTTGAYNLLQALKLIREREIPLEALVETLTLGRRSPSREVEENLKRVLASQPGFQPAREVLAWKLLSLDKPEEARSLLDDMIEDEADGQSIAALRFGLQTHNEEQILDMIFDGGAAPRPAEEPSGVDLPDVTEFQEPSHRVETVTPVSIDIAPSDEPQEIPVDAAPDQEAGEAAAPAETAPPDQEAEEPTPPPPEEAAEAEAPAAKSPPAARRSAEKKTGLVGQISLFGVPDLLQFFCNSRRTGMIAFSSQLGEARLRLCEGSLCWGESPANPSAVDFLRDSEAMTGEQLDSEDGDNVSALLAQDGLDNQKVHEALGKLLRLTIRDLVDWTDGWFEFDAIEDQTPTPAALQFNAQGVLLDVLRAVDEEGR